MLDKGKFWEMKRPVRWNDTFIYASSFSYLAAALVTLIGYPLMDSRLLPLSLQVGFYLMPSCCC